MSTPLNASALARLQDLEESYARDLASLLSALTEENPGPAERLMRWIFENDINPFSVFSSPNMAHAMGSIQGAAGVLFSLNHAFHDDGDISFPITEGHGPYIAMMDAKDPTFEKAFKEEIARFGHASYVIAGHSVTGFARDVDEFINVFEEYERAYRETYNRFLEND